MTTLASMNPLARGEAEERRRMQGVFLDRALESPGKLHFVYYAAYMALNRLCKDSTKTGAAKQRIYKKILDEVTINVARINIGAGIEPRA